MKQIKFLSICCVAVFLLTACSNRITVKGENGTEYESYQECCAAQDFQAAHQYLAKLENSEIGGYYDAKEYVFKQEALYLMSIGDESAKKRLIYLLKEEGGDNYYNNRINGHVAMLIDLAIDNDDEVFVKTLANQYNSDVEKDDLKKVVEYLSNKDMTGNCDYLISLLNNLKATTILLDYAINSGNIDLVKKIAPKGLNIQDSELISQLASLKNKDISDDIINLISKIKIKGSRIPKGMHDWTTFEKNYSHYRPDYIDYMKSINDYNKVCDQILEIAISKGNDYLAKNVLIKYKEDVYKLQGSRREVIKAPDGKRLDNSDFYYVYYINDSKNNAQKRYREAKMNGAFK